MRSWCEFHCISAKATQNWNAPPYSFPLISSPFEPNLTIKLPWMGALLLCPSAPAWMIPDFPQIFKHVPCHSLACIEEGKLATSRAATTPPRSEAAHLCFDVADLLGTGEYCCFSTQISPRGNELSWQLATDYWHLPEGLRPTVGTDTSMGSFDVYPRLEVGHLVFNECSYFAQRQPQAGGFELVSQSLKVFWSEGSAWLVMRQKPIVKSGNSPKFLQFLNGHWDQFDV